MASPIAWPCENQWPLFRPRPLEMAGLNAPWSIHVKRVRGLRSHNVQTSGVESIGVLRNGRVCSKLAARSKNQSRRTTTKKVQIHDKQFSPVLLFRDWSKAIP